MGRHFACRMTAVSSIGFAPAMFDIKKSIVDVYSVMSKVLNIVDRNRLNPCSTTQTILSVIIHFFLNVF